MKTIIRIFLISFLAAVSLIYSGCAPDHDHSGHSDEAHGIVVAADHKLVSMRVPQIHCPPCKAEVEAVLKNAGLVNFEVWLHTERNQNVIVVFDPKKISQNDIIKLITELEKTVENIIEN